MNHRTTVQPYLAKHGIFADTILFVFNSGDEYMKRAFLDRGWAENPLAQSHIFDLRWDLNENNVNFEELGPGQLCNHFPNNQELTTKTGLARNLQRLTELPSDPDRFFPRCYDFTEERQIQSFICDFHRTGVINLLRRHCRYFKRVHGIDLAALRRRMTRFEQRRTKLWAKGVYLPFPAGDGNNNKTVNLAVLEWAMAFAKHELAGRAGELTDKAEAKWCSYQKAVKNLPELLCAAGAHPLPYSAADKAEISVSCGGIITCVGGAETSPADMERTESVSGVQGD